MPSEQNLERAKLLFSLRAALRWNSDGDQPAPARRGKTRMTEPGWQLVETLKEFRALLEHVRDYAIFSLDREGNVRSWNNGAKAIKQYEANEIVGQHFSRFYVQEDIEAGKPMRLLELAAAQGRAEDEGWRVRKDGSRLWASVVISAVRDDVGKLIGFTKVTRDMTERRRAEQEVARRAVQQAAIAELGIQAVRSPFLEPVLYKALELVAKTLGTEICEIFELQPDNRSLLLRASTGWRSGSTGRVTVAAGTESEPGFALLSGEPLEVEDLASERRFRPGPLRDYGVVSGIGLLIPIPGQVRPFGVLGAHSSKRLSFSPDDVRFFTSITNLIASAIGRSRAEEQIRRAETAAAEERERAAQAEEAIRGRDVFLAAASHELRTPLTALQLKLQSMQAMIRRDFPASALAAKGQARLQDALRQGRRLGEVVERLLDVSRIAAGRFEVDLKPLALESVVRDVVADFEERARASQSKIRLSISGKTFGTWDRGRLEQVVRNLLTNAVKYGEGKPVEISIDGQDSEVRFTVRDQGIGIANADIERIFDPFERAASVKHFGGLGLGLYIVRHIVEAHGGTIEVISTPGAGTTFIVTLPREAPSADEHNPQAQEAARLGS
jgi:PAS domain S-box-containing protein